MLKTIGFFVLMAALAGSTLAFGAEGAGPARGDGDRLVTDGGMTPATDRVPAVQRHRYDPRQASRTTAPSPRKGKDGVGTIEESSPSAVAGVIAAVPDNDLCAAATPISGTGTFAFDNTAASEDGPSHGACIDEYDPEGSIDHDVWFCWTPTHSGPVELTTCNGTTVDTKIAVYNGCACPPTDGRLYLYPMGCQDDDLYCQSQTNVQTTVGLLAQYGQSYLIRIGTYPGDGSGEPPAPGGTGTFDITGWDLLCEQDVSSDDCQAFHPSNASWSNRIDYTVADNFTPVESGEITEVCWWGSYWLDFPGGDRFEIRYLEDNGGLPGNLMAGPFRQQYGTLTVSEPARTCGGRFFPVFEYAGVHAPVPVIGGQRYWIEITNDSGTTNPWYWQISVEGDSVCFQDGEELAPPDGYDSSDEDIFDMAFCLGVPFGAALPSTSPCAGASGPCCEENPTLQPACEDPECCAKVCACDSLCCDPGNGWDMYCAGTGFVTLDGDGCGAAILCSASCGDCPDAPVTWLNPTTEAVDARQPYPIDDPSSPLGFDSVLVEAPAWSGEACWSFCETGDGGSANEIADITDYGGTYRIKLERPIGPGALAQITYTSNTAAGQTGSFSSLPGDASGNGTANPADIDYLISCVNSPGSCAAWQTDINRSGSANAQDILRLIDLLNGAGEFEVWNGTSVPTDCP